MIKLLYISNGCQTSCGFNHYSVIILSKLLATIQHLRFSCRAEVEDFFKRMDRDYDGRLSFGEFMGEETPLEKVNVIFVGLTSVFILISTKVGLLN